MTENDVSLIDRYIAGLIDGMADPRVGSVLSGPMNDDLKAHVRGGYVEWFMKVVGAEGHEFSGFSGGEGAAPDADSAAAFVESERGDLQQVSVAAIAGLIGDFVASRRAQVIGAMDRAGEGPSRDRTGRIAESAELLKKAESALNQLSSAESVEDGEEIVERARGILDEARDILGLVALDDGILYGSTAEASAAAGGAIPELTPRGRREDVESMLFDSWMMEVDAHMKLAALAGGRPDQCGIAPEEQRHYILDAVVAVQEAMMLRPDRNVLLRFAELRLAKGDVGEARAACEKLLEITTGEDSEIRERTRCIMAAVEQASPLVKKDKRCFIATAAMGDIDAPEVQSLRDFRDEVLMTSGFGRAMVRTYYRLSPPLAGFIADKPAARRAVRRLVVVPLAGMVGKRGR